MDATLTALEAPTDGITFTADASKTLDDLTTELTSALDNAFWAFDFQGELEDALDAALLRMVLAGTPIFSGELIAVAA